MSESSSTRHQALTLDAPAFVGIKWASMHKRRNDIDTQVAQPHQTHCFVAVLSGAWNREGFLLGR